MNIRRAKSADTDGIMRLLSQVLEIHAAIRPDIFISGTTKYSADELAAIFADENRPVYVAVDEDDTVLGYAFCVIKQQPQSANLVPFTSLYIDDLCVDNNKRGSHIGQVLLSHVKEEAKHLGCYEIALNVWEGNDNARAFYEHCGFTPVKTMMEYIL